MFTEFRSFSFSCQSRDTNICGQCCLSYILGCTVNESIYLIGHSNKTRRSELITYFPHGELIRGYPYDGSGCKFALLACQSIDSDKPKHWAIHDGDMIYDPALGIVKRNIWLGWLKVTSYTPILI